jgi:hypothetical protein
MMWLKATVCCTAKNHWPMVMRVALSNLWMVRGKLMGAQG